MRGEEGDSMNIQCIRQEGISGCRDKESNLFRRSEQGVGFLFDSEEMAMSESREAELRDRADAIFEAVLDLEPSSRADYLARECEGDEELLELVRRLIEHLEEETEISLDEGGALQGSLAREWSEELADESTALPSGTIVDRFRIVRRIGRGGMADVYLAERADGQFEQRVALKVIQKGLESRPVLLHFERERQILASARHENIARLIDGGETDHGRPYLVMEYVEGEPIDVYCDRLKLNSRERLELFTQVTKAVDYAHRSLIVHRDIKPSNILVSRDGQVKLLDFGIARLLEADPGLTQTSGDFMTPAFASPEQVLGEPVTTASDVYQLGLLLFLLLTGRSPYRTEDESLPALSRAIAEDSPSRPSQALALRRESAGKLNEKEVAEICASRRTSLANLRRELKGDLDTIVLMALRKEPERRYGSVAELGLDIDDHLECRTIRARPDTLGYRLGKFARRHSIAVSIAAIALIAIVALVTFYTVQLRAERDRAAEAALIAEQEAATATEISDFLVGLFRFSDPSEARGGELSLREVLDRGASRIEELQGQPLTQARLMVTIAGVYKNFGLLDEARPLAERSLHLRREELEQGHRDIAISLVEVARIEREAGHFELSGNLFGEAIEILKAGGGEPDALQALALNSLAMLYREQGHMEQAAEYHEEALAILESTRGPEHVDTAEALQNLALVYRDLDRLQEAAAMYERVLPILRRELGENHAHVGVTVNNLGLVEQDLGRLDEAEQSFRRSAQVLEAAFGADHPFVGRAIYNLGEVLLDAGRLDQAEGHLRRSLEIMLATYGEEHLTVATARFGLGKLFRERNDLVAAERELRRTVEIREKLLPPDNQRLATSREVLEEVLRETGQAPQ